MSAKAASVSLSIQTKNPKIYVGDKIYVVISLTSSTAIKGFEGYFTYDNTYLRYETGGSVVYGNDDAFRVLDMERSASSTKIKYSVCFTARKEGSVSIYLKKPYNVIADDDNNTKMSVSYNTLNLLIEKSDDKKSDDKKSDDKKSDDKKKVSTPKPTAEMKEEKVQSTKTPKNDIAGSSKLRKLKIDGMDLAPEFESDIEKYSGIISTSKEKLDITYEKEDDNAKVKISGNKKIKEGKNSIKITVTGTTGKKNVYRITATVEKISPEEENDSNKISAINRNGKIVLDGEISIVVGSPENGDVPDGFIKNQIELDGEIVDCYSLESDMEAQYVLIYNEEDKIFYLFDKQTKGIFPYEKVKDWYLNNGRNQISTMALNEEKEKSYYYMLGIMATFSLLMFLFCVYFFIKARKK